MNYHLKNLGRGEGHDLEKGENGKIFESITIH
jgi:hypothetical protein